MNQKLTFTAFLQDNYSKQFNKLADGTDEGIAKITKDLDKLGRTSKTVASNIDTIEKKISSLTKTKRLSLNTDTIKAADREIKALQKQKAKLEGVPAGGGGMGLLGKIGGRLAMLGGGIAIGSIIGNGLRNSINASMEREQQRITLGVLTGGQRAGDNLMGNLVKMAGRTPFGTSDLMKGAQTMLGFGVDKDKLLPYMKQLGDISGGDAGRFQSLTLAFSQMHSTGRLMGQDLLQMINAGFNPLNEISKTTGKNIGELKKEMEQGKISVEMVTNAMKSATSEGGTYFGLMEKQSQTTQGKLSTLKDEANELAVIIGNKMTPTIKSAIGGLSSLVSTVKGWVEVPVSKTIQDQATRLRALRSELIESNTTQSRRKEIIEKIKTDYPDYLKGIDLEKDGYAKINEKLKETIDLLEKKSKRAFLDSVVQKEQDSLSALFSEREEKMWGFRQKYSERFPDIFNQEGLTDADRIKMVQERLAGRGAKYGQQYQSLESGDVQYLSLLSSRIKSQEKRLDETKTNVERQLFESGLWGIKNDDNGNSNSNNNGNSNNNSLTSDDSSKGKSVPSISGGQKITNLTINIDGLVKGGVQISSTTVREGAAQMKDIVTEALLSAVNDTNLAVGN